MKFFITVLVSLVAVTGASAQGNMEADARRDAAETKDVATRALATFQEMSKRSDLKSMGVQSAEEMANAALGEPLSVFMVGLEDLRGYQAGSDPNRLLKPIGKVIYPVTAGSEVRSSIVLQKGKEGWKASNFGGTNFARLITSARDRTATATSLPPAAFFVVQVPALNAYFIGFRQSDKLMLSAVIDDPKLNLKAGTPMPAEQVFGDLVSVAQKYNGLPL